LPLSSVQRLVAGAFSELPGYEIPLPIGI